MTLNDPGSNLSAFNLELNDLRGASKNPVKRLDHMRAKHGDHPKVYLQRRMGGVTTIGYHTYTVYRMA